MLKIENRIIENLDNILDVAERTRNNLMEYGFKKENSDIKEQTFKEIYDVFDGDMQEWCDNVRQLSMYYEQSREDFEEETKNDK